MTLIAVPICLRTGCNKPARRNHNDTQYLKYCSLECQHLGGSAAGAEKRRQTCLERYGATTNLKSDQTKQKIRETCIKRYGSTHAMKNPTLKSKVLETKKQRYGDSAYNNRNKFQQTMSTKTTQELVEIVQNRIQTNREKYGVDYVLQVPEIRDRIKSTSLDRYGFENPAQHPEIRNKIRNTMQDKYGCHWQQQHISTQTLALLQDPLWLQTNTTRTYAELAEDLGVTYYTVARAFEIQGIEHTPEPTYRSTGEQQLLDWLKNLGLDVVANSRSIIDHNKELDIWIPSKNVAIEYNGLYWHSELSGRSKFYHQNKYQQCQAQGIQLIQITDWHWQNLQELVKARLTSKLGLISNRIGARSCVIKTVGADDAKSFLEQHHIQGSCVSSVRLGLYHQDRLVALMTLGRNRFQHNQDWELIRYATDQNISVVGGAGKLFASFVKNNQPHTVISFCDLNWNSGNLYAQLGFEWQRNTPPNYWYTHQYRTFENRMRYQKHRLAKLLENFDDSVSEWENMKKHGWDRYWDAGSSVWLWKNSSVINSLG